MPNRFAFALSCAVWLASSWALAQSAPGAAAAQETPSTTLSPVTVKAAPSPKVIEREAHSFVPSYAATPNPNIDQNPIQAWYVTGTASQGVDYAAIMGSGLPGSDVPQIADVADDPTNTPPAGCFDRFTACYKSTFHNVLIVADSRALEGKPLGVVADDMVMLALSQPRSLDGCNALPSVIDRFAASPCPGRDPPSGLTPADAAYLTALYSSAPDGKKRFEQTEIADRMAKILITAVAQGR